MLDWEYVAPIRGTDLIAYVNRVEDYNPDHNDYTYWEFELRATGGELVWACDTFRAGHPALGDVTHEQMAEIAYQFLPKEDT